MKGDWGSDDQIFLNWRWHLQSYAAAPHSKHIATTLQRKLSQLPQTGEYLQEIKRGRVEDDCNYRKLRLPHKHNGFTSLVALSNHSKNPKPRI